MDSINTTVISVNVMKSTDEEIEAGAQPSITILQHTALVLQAPGMQPVPVPYGAHSFEMGKKDALEIGNQIIEAAESLPDPKPVVETATSVPGELVERAQDFERKLKEGTAS